MNVSTTLGLVALWVAGTCHAVTLSNIVAGVSVNSYSNFHAGLFTSDGNSRGFTDGPSPRVPLEQHDLARDYIASNFETMGFDTWLDPFSFTYSSGHTYSNCNNVVAVKWGNGGTNVYILGAHYDSVDNGHVGGVTFCPGADDNASGTAALLETARAIKDYVFRDTLVIIAFDAEEKDYQGSKHFVNTHITENAAETNRTTFLKSSIQAMVNLDTIAYNVTNTPWRLVIGRVGSFNSVAFLMADAATTYTTLTPRHASGYDLSDHISFNSAGIPSVHLIEYDFDDYAVFEDAGKNPYIHKDGDSTDSPDYIDYAYATEITKCVVGAICDNTGIIPPATLSQSISSNRLEVSWMGAPEVEYNLYGAVDLLQTNGWDFLQHIPATNASTLREIELDLAATSQTMFRVESE